MDTIVPIEEVNLADRGSKSGMSRLCCSALKSYEAEWRRLNKPKGMLGTNRHKSLKSGKRSLTAKLSKTDLISVWSSRKGARLGVGRSSA